MNTLKLIAVCVLFALTACSDKHQVRKQETSFEDRKQIDEIKFLTSDSEASHVSRFTKEQIKETKSHHTNPSTKTFTEAYQLDAQTIEVMKEAQTDRLSNADDALFIDLNTDLGRKLLWSHGEYCYSGKAEFAPEHNTVTLLVMTYQTYQLKIDLDEDSGFNSLFVTLAATNSEGATSYFYLGHVFNQKDYRIYNIEPSYRTRIEEMVRNLQIMDNKLVKK